MAATTLPPDLALQLEQARARIARQRVEAFIDYTPRVCGLDLQPLTLRSYNRLLAFDSPFVNGGAIDVEAVALFVWLHHPDFGQHARVARGRVVRQVWRALHPRFPHLNAFFLLASQLLRWRWLRWFTVPTPAERFATAVATIRHLVDEAMRDFPRDAGAGEDENGNPRTETEGPRVALQAQILNVFARTLRLSHAETEAMPLKRVVQLLRESLDASGGAKRLGMMHPEEARVWRDYLSTP